MAENYESLGVIGQGQYGTAYKARHKGDNKLYCLKKITMTAKDDIQGALNEAKLLSSLNHPNIIGYKESYLDKEGALSIVTTYCEEGDLFKRIRRHQSKNEYLSEKEVMDVFIQIASALAYIHSRKILHRDLKTQNIFIARGGIIQLGDFGISKVLEKTDSFATTVTGTPYYMAPEICTNQPYTFKSDIWSLGCVLYELCTLKHAFAADSLLSLVYQIVRGNYPPIPADLFTPELEQLVETLLNRDPNTRPTLQQIFQMPYVMLHVKRYQQEQRSRVLQQRSSLNKSLGKSRLTISPAMRAVAEDDLDSLTPRERMQRKKQLAAQKREMELQLASISVVRDRAEAQTRAQKMIHGSGVAVVGDNRSREGSPGLGGPRGQYEGVGGTIRSGTPGYGADTMGGYGDSMVNMGTMPTQGPGSTVRSNATRGRPGNSIMDRDELAGGRNAQDRDYQERDYQERDFPAPRAINAWDSLPQRDGRGGQDRDNMPMTRNGGDRDPGRGGYDRDNNAQAGRANGYDRDNTPVGRTSGYDRDNGQGSRANGYDRDNTPAGRANGYDRDNTPAGRANGYDRDNTPVGRTNGYDRNGAPVGRGGMERDHRDNTPVGRTNGYDRDNVPVGGRGGRDLTPPGRSVLDRDKSPMTRGGSTGMIGAGSRYGQGRDEDEEEMLMGSVVHQGNAASVARSSMSPDPSRRAPNGVHTKHGGGIAGVGFKFGLDTGQRASVNQWGFGAQTPEQPSTPYADQTPQSSSEFPGVSQVRFGIASNSRPRGSFVHVIHSTAVLHNDDLDDDVVQGDYGEDEEEWDTYEEELEDFGSEDEDVNEVKQRIKILNNVNELSKSTSLEGPAMDAAPHPEVQDRLATLTKNGKLAGLQERCRGTLGAQFMEVYSYLKRVRSSGSSGVDEKEVQRKLLEIVGGDRQKLQGCFICDQLVFQEMMYQ